MRDPNRITAILELMRQYWTERPDLRLGQMLSNFSFNINKNSNPFYLEDTALQLELETVLKNPPTDYIQGKK